MFSGLLINMAWMFILVEVFKLWYMASVVIVSAGLMFYNFFNLVKCSKYYAQKTIIDENILRRYKQIILCLWDFINDHYQVFFNQKQ